MKVGIIVALALSLVACGEKSASQDELKSLETRVEMAEDQIEEMQTTIKYTKEIKEWEAAKKQEEDRRSSELSRLRQGEQQVEGAQRMLCDATGDC